MSDVNRTAVIGLGADWGEGDGSAGRQALLATDMLTTMRAAQASGAAPTPSI